MGVVEETRWGKFGSHTAYLYTLHGGSGATAKILNYGGRLQSLNIPDSNGKVIDVVLGFDTLEGYLTEDPFFGATIGRCANRIAKGQFELDGELYQLKTNDSAGSNHIHGGPKGFDKKFWETSNFGQNSNCAYIELTHTSADGDEGYPGTVETKLTFTLNNNNELRITMEGRSDKATLLNLSNHTYWNLNGHQAGSVIDHELTILGNGYTPVDRYRIPTGEILGVIGTPFDFTKPRKMGQNLTSIPSCGPEDPGGYDHNYVINDTGEYIKLAARVSSKNSGLNMEVKTNQPGVQFYTGNFLTTNISGKNGAIYDKFHGFCLETQKFPNSINQFNTPEWPNVILRPGEIYNHEVRYCFSTEMAGCD